jgi:hypothetical protein
MIFRAAGEVLESELVLDRENEPAAWAKRFRHCRQHGLERIGRAAREGAGVLPHAHERDDIEGLRKLSVDDIATDDHDVIQIPAPRFAEAGATFAALQCHHLMALLAEETGKRPASGAEFQNPALSRELHASKQIGPFGAQVITRGPVANPLL